jgi:putative Mn2+ efflux pump MntP
VRQFLLSAGLIAPLALDTFALAAGLGIAGMTGRDRIRVTIVFTAFEAGMPIVGILAGRVLGSLLGDWAGYAAMAVLFAAGLLLVRPGRDEEAEARRLRLVASARGFAILTLGLGISLDELTIGLSAGLIGLSIVVTVAWIAVQAFLAAQVGLRIGSRVSDALRDRAEWLAGAMLIALAVTLLVLRLLKIS